MDTPPIRYARTSDGVRIAYCAMGQGPPLVMAPFTLWASHIQRELGFPAHRRWYELIAQHCTLIRLDTRGCGLSDLSTDDFSREALSRDIDAVVDDLGLDQFALFGSLLSSGLAVGYAATRPTRVTELVLWCAAAGGEAAERSIWTRTRAALQEIGPEFAEEVLFRIGMGLDEDGRAARAFVAQNLNPRTRAMLGGSAQPYEIESLAHQVRARTLVLNPDAAMLYPLEGARDVAMAIPNASLTVVPGDSQSPLLGLAEVSASHITSFVAGGSDATGAARQGFQTVLFTDLESSTALTQRLGDEGAQELLRGHNATVRGALEEHGGREVKHTGDGIMASFPSAVAAVTAALQMQRELAGGEVRARIGLNAGEPIAEDDDLFGLSVIKAARIGDRAEPGQVLVSDVVRQLCEGKMFEFTSVGEATLKGFDEPVALYAVRAT
jgi:class 3 adenylate cyclase